MGVIGYDPPPPVNIEEARRRYFEVTLAPWCKTGESMMGRGSTPSPPPPPPYRRLDPTAPLLGQVRAIREEGAREVFGEKEEEPMKDQTNHIGSVGVDLKLDTSGFDAELEHAKVRLDAVRHAAPPLMIFADRNLPLEVLERLQSEMARAVAEGKTLVFMPGLSVYQLIDGRWQQIGPQPSP